MNIPIPTEAQLRSEQDFIEKRKLLCQQVLKDILEKEKLKKDTSKKKASSSKK